VVDDMGLSLKKPIRGIFLDIGWTMLRPRSGDWMITEKFLECANIKSINDYDRSKLLAAFARAIEFLKIDHFVFNEEKEYTQFIEYYRIISEDVPEFNLSESAVKEIAHDRVYGDNYIFYDDAISTIKELSKDYKLGIISDTWPAIKNELIKADIYECFSSITFSCYLGVLKPASKMYEHALEKINLPAQETIFVDDYPKMLLGAEKLGIQPVLISRELFSPRDDLPLSIPKFTKIDDSFVCIRSLDELKNIL
jgi:HAD superfamily hydrolase (TIGR01509 family)